jgi:hypothetical protein
MGSVRNDERDPEVAVSAGWVLVQTLDGTAPQVAASLTALPGVELVEQTVGAYDLVVRIADAGPQVRSAKRVMQAALRVPGVTLAVCCHEGANREVGASVDLTRSIDLTGAALEPSR